MPAAVGQGAGRASVVPQDFPALHLRQHVFDAGADLAVDGVEIVLPVGQCPVGGFTVGHDHVGVALLTAVSHHRKPGQFLVDAGGAVDGAVVAVARLWVAGGDDQAGVDVDATCTLAE
nr:hypothetical protein [Kibdelosporangium sp. MJ126-NF4]